MFYKIVNLKLYLSDTYGNLGRMIAENVAFATFNEKNKIFLVTKMDGKLETRDTNGNLIRTIYEGVLEARFVSESEITIRLRDGRNAFMDLVGNLKRFY